MMKECKKHGYILHYLRKDKNAYRCSQCSKDAVNAGRHKRKAILIAEAGGCCVNCGYDRSIWALDFHHVNREEKSFTISNNMMRGIDRLREEAAKCILLCANCHRELHAGII